MDHWITRIPIREFSNLSLNLSEFGRNTLESSETHFVRFRLRDWYSLANERYVFGVGALIGNLICAGKDR
jgi:hypothetical protein